MGNRLRYLRETKGLTQKDLADKLFVSKSTIGNIETGISNISLRYLDDLADYFEVSASYFHETNPTSVQLEEVLKETFQALLNNDIISAERISKQTGQRILNPFQELSANLLLGAISYKQRNVEELNKLSLYIALFTKDLSLLELSLEQKKHYYFYLLCQAEFEGRFESCLPLSDELLKLSGESLYSAQVNLTRVSLYLELGKADEAFLLITNLIEIIKALDDPLLLSWAYIQLSRVYGEFQMYDKCLEILLLLEKVVNEHDLDNHKTVLAQHRGFLYSQKKDFNMAIRYYEEALSYPKTAEREVTLLTSLLALSLKTKDIIRSEKYLEEARKCFSTPKEKAIFLSYEGELHLLKGNEKLYIKCQEKAIVYFKTHNHTSNLKYIYHQLTKFYCEQKKPAKLAYYFKEMGKLDETA